VTVYLTVGDVLALHEQEVGANLLADFGLLESAVLRPQTTIGGEDAYPDLHTKAAAMFHSLARNHAFLDGNKRVAVAATPCSTSSTGTTWRPKPTTWSPWRSTPPRDY
jgi:death-on-curing protein